MADGFTLDMLNETMLWGVSRWHLAVAIALLFLGFLSRRLILWFFRSILARVTAKTKITWDNDFVELMPTPVALTAQLGLWYAAVHFLDLPDKPVHLERYAREGLKVALAVAGLWVLFRLIDVFSNAMGRASAKTESRLDDQIVPMVRKTAKVVVSVTIFVMVVQNLGYSVTSLIASLGVGGLALALAAKDTVANLFGSVVVFTDRPFQVGDWVNFDGIEGTVEEVGFRTTRVRRFDKALVTVPNQTFSTTAITNFSARSIRRMKFNVGVTYETKAPQLKLLLEELRQLLKDHPGIDQGFHFVHFTELADSSLNLQVYCFSKSTVWVEFLKARESLLLSIMEVVEKHGLEMAFPTRTVYLRDEQWKA